MTERTAYLTGSTYLYRQILAEHGWKWDAEREAWKKAAEWTDEADVIRAVRRYAGIRNRGNFEAALE